MPDTSTARVVDSYPLSPMQHGMLYQFLSAPETGETIEQVVCTLYEAVDVDRLRDAWNTVVARHPALRTRLRWQGVDEPLQEVLEAVDVPWDVRSWQDAIETQLPERLDQFLTEDRARGFDLEAAPLMRIALRQVGPSHGILVWTLSHLLLDGRSFPIVLKEVFNLYDAARRGETFPLPDAPAYRPHIEKLQTHSNTTSETFWRSRLEGFCSPTALPAAGVGGGEVSAERPVPVEREDRLSESCTRRLSELAAEQGLTLNTLVQGAWSLLLSRHSGETDVLFGVVRACRRSSVPEADATVGLFMNTVPVRVAIEDERPWLAWLKDLRAAQRDVWEHENTPLALVQQWSDVPAGQRLFDSLLVFDHVSLNDQLREQGGDWQNRHFQLYEHTSFPLTVCASGGDELRVSLRADAALYNAETLDRLLHQLTTLLRQMGGDPEAKVSELSMLSHKDRQRILEDWNASDGDCPVELCVHQLFEQQQRLTPEALACVYEDESLTYRELNERANRLAHALRARGVGPDVLVGVSIERSLDMVVAILGVQKAGGAYVPLDPAFPASRVALMIEDSRTSLIVTQAHLVSQLPPTRAAVLCIDADWETQIAPHPADDPQSPVAPGHLAYVIYTSGSTGRPKGVMVEHRNVVNFFTGMDERLEHDSARENVWLAVTSLSFDISVLELLWTLSRGFKVVLYSDRHRPRPRVSAEAGRKPMRFGLFYFASDEAERTEDKYRLLMEGARFADRNGFVSVSTPERHFHEFGGLYPNPAVTGAAIAAVTRNVQIRAGSVVIPLHHPIRVAEEWAVVDNLSHGRVGISFASGWQPADFIIRPEAYKDRHQALYDGIECVKRLWRGERLEFLDAAGNAQSLRTLPRPVQKQLPVWITTAGNIETWKSAGRVGANVLTHLLGQSVDEIARKIEVYRGEYRAAGHPGEGCVTLMLHTFVGDDDEDVRETVRGPMTDYLRSALSLVKGAAAEWTAFKRRGDGTASEPTIDLDSLTGEEREDLLAFSFERYFSTSGLFGTPQQCLEMVRRLQTVGVNEIACLIDFGVDSERVLKHLHHLNRVRQMAEEDVAVAVADPLPAMGDETIGALIERHRVTHLQCTPSMASMILADDEARAALGRLRVMMIGGEAFPVALARKLRAASEAVLINMYGPTETTIWSSTYTLAGDEPSIPIGRPIANTQLYVLNNRLQLVPPGVVGELFIGGAGVVRGYHDRPDLTDERFVRSPFSDDTRQRIYRTGDLARFRGDGVVEFLGRVDHQVKLRGYRIELGEIETTMAEYPGIREAVVLVREDTPGDQRLVGYYTAEAGAGVDEQELKRTLAKALPEYMVPSRFVALESFPQTPNRKVDRKALPAPATSTTAQSPLRQENGSATTATEAEAQIARIWQDVLGIQDAGRDDNFFDLGGHSLLAVKAHRRLKETFPGELKITDLFRFPTVRTLAAYLGNGVHETSIDQSQQRGAARREQLMHRRQSHV